MIKAVLSFLLLLIHSLSSASDSKEIYSPDKKIMVRIEAEGKLRYSIFYLNKEIVSPSWINMTLNDGSSLTGKLSLKNSKYRQVRTTIISPVPEKRKIIPDVYNELEVRFKQPFSLIIRVYNDGFAYRFASHLKDSIIVTSENAEINIPNKPEIYFSQVVKRENADIFHTSFEEPYEKKRIDSIGRENLIFSPLLVAPADGPKLVLTESDIEDYPGMFLSGNNNSVLYGVFAGYPIDKIVTEGEFPQAVVTKRADYIARTSGTRKYPWRVIIVANEDRELPANDIVYRLASPSRVGDYSWIKPGKGTDEWIIGVNLFNVPFKSGVNTATYKFYIDFAKRFGFDRIMMDAGWSDYKDLFKINPAIDMNEISAYAKEKGIGLSMWTLAMTLERQLEPALDQFNKWGVDFIMTDFMDRDDQEMVQFYHRIAKACADHKIMVMYHGAFKPAGFNRTYPHAVTREGVLGSEYNIWSEKATPGHDLLLPFIRMTSGPMDYEPGILDNATAKTFRPIGDKVMSMGTRLHQMAMFVVYESPIQLFSGNPSQGLMEPEFMNILGQIPTTWDTTIILDARLGEYIITARKKDGSWFIGAMCDWTARDIEVDLSFLSSEKYDGTFCEDGINADRYPSDYKITKKIISKDEKLRIKMMPGGGFVGILRQQ